MKVTARQLRKIIKEEAGRFLYENKEGREAALIAKIKKMTFKELWDAYPGVPILVTLGDTPMELSPAHVFITSLGYDENDVIGDMIKRDGLTGSPLTVSLSTMMSGMLAMEPAESGMRVAAEDEDVEVETEEEN